ncbi:transposase family protein [Micromonospora haikouensis]|uniref:transposase family protein n=1 Tax=Micromonospora haikouensis TaxID=686309 RepID=UPI0037A452D0
MDSEPAPVTDREHNGLLHAVASVPDPRDPRGIRYPLTGLLTVAVCAVLASASSFRRDQRLAARPRRTGPDPTRDLAFISQRGSGLRCRRRWSRTAPLPAST